MLPERTTHPLRIGRVSREGARYFLTCCVKERRPVLTETENLARVLRVLKILHETGDIALHGASVMPDHVHLLFTLGGRLSFGRVLAKFKNLVRDKGRVSWQWLDDGFEHRLRPEDDIEDYGFYVFMNPYRAGLVRLDQPWPGWVSPDKAVFRFSEALRPGGLPQPEWLDTVEAKLSRIVVDKRFR